MQCSHGKFLSQTVLRATKGFRVEAFSLIGAIAVVVVILIFGLGIAVFMPGHRGGCRELSKRLVCGSNLKGLGTTSRIYANDHGGNWPVPPFDESFAGRIDYRVSVGGGEGTLFSPSRNQPSVSGPDGTRKLGVSRALWMLVRSGDITTKQFLCPTSGDVEILSEALDQYYDFKDRTNLSYGYQVPFGAAATRAREGSDIRMVFAADKGPYKNSMISTPAAGLTALVLARGELIPYTPKEWGPFQSANHPKEGQNVLYADGHTEFKRVPTIGVDGDNIYTIALDNTHEPSRTAGESPWMRASPPFSSTDSVIFP